MMRGRLFNSLSSLRRNYSPHFRDPKNSDRILSVTEAACDQLKDLGRKFPGKKLRVAVEAGGCQGFQYKFSLDTDFNIEDDTVFTLNNSDQSANSDLSVVCDNTSWSIIKEAKLDYSKELIGSAFRIVDNPEAASGCGCGVSFDLKHKIK